MSEELDSLEDLVRLLQDVFRLREDISQNARDFELRKRPANPIKFRYLVDTEVVRLYAEPSRWAERLAALPSLRDLEIDPEDVLERPGHRQPIRQTVLEANALLTGEFVFSKQLAGEAEDDRILVSPEHVLEVMSYLAHLEARSGGSAQQRALGVDPYVGLRHSVTILQRLDDANTVEASELLERMRDTMVAGLSDTTHSDMLAPYRLGRLFKGDLMGNAAGNLSFSTEVLSPPAAELRWWADQIRAAKRSNRQPPSPAAVEADAVTLAQLAALNRDWQKTREVFVLITDDRGLRAAYLQWLRKEEQQGRDNFYPLRASRQYIPILNINEMGGAFQEAHSFKEITEAVSTFIEMFYSNEIQEVWGGDERFRTPPRSALRQALLGQLSAFQDYDEVDALVRKLNEQARHIAMLWARALTYSATAKADTIKEVVAGELKYWHAILSSPELHKAFAEEVRNLSDGFGAMTATTSLLRDEIRALQARLGSEGSGDPVVHGRREIASEFRAFQSVDFAGRTIREAVEQVKATGEDAEDLLRNVKREERLLVMAALCLDIGAWVPARNLLQQAELAIEAKAASELVPEIQFLRCVARRLAADERDWRSEFRVVDDQLARLTRGDAATFEKMRAASERFSLCLCAHVLELKHAGDSRRLTVAYGLWSEFRLQAGRSPLWEAASQTAWGRVRRQFELNTMLLSFWTHVQHKKLPGDIAKATTEMLARHSAENAEGTPIRRSSIYAALAEYALYADRRADLGSKIVADLDAILAQDQRSGFTFDIPSVDRDEYEYVRRILESPRQ